MFKKIFKNPYVKNVLSAVAVAIFGFILLNLTFLFDVLFQSLIDKTLGLFVRTDFNMAWKWLPPLKHGAFFILILLISWFVLKSKLSDICKAAFSTVPVAVIFVTIGIITYQWPVISFSISALVFTGIIYYLYRTKKSWLYYYAVILVALVLLVMNLTGAEI